MPKLKIGDKTINRILSARVQVYHGENDHHEARLIPHIQFLLHLPMDHDATLAKWALAPIGDNRFKPVALTMQDRSGTDKKEWKIEKAYVYRYEEIEYPPQSGSANDQGNYVELVIRGIVANGQDYDGTNIVAVKDGQPEATSGEKAGSEKQG
jgi:hypothetical protein